VVDRTPEIELGDTDGVVGLGGDHLAVHKIQRVAMEDVVEGATSVGLLARDGAAELARLPGRSRCFTTSDS
jgi:hypothetical protein